MVNNLRKKKVIQQLTGIILIQWIKAGF